MDYVYVSAKIDRCLMSIITQFVVFSAKKKNPTAEVAVRLFKAEVVNLWINFNQLFRNAKTEFIL